ncbi:MULTISPECIES: hypothetical protein [Asaia]|uniref:Uncharacterized protein n=1 Tax=Asaia bogorensis TaxID=91915 RepID=A0A060QKT3_9PROT|nr:MULTISPECIES: hypothetical protein [Asaia]ETC98273.1 hypothetical protein P792_11100 [Asaia sp. SF2.1]MDL2171698.1 hypothetical protein [Asaia sp. HumB]CDG40171.1 hypothetical protein ASAP_2126 [Asaia bogorensis]
MNDLYRIMKDGVPDPDPPRKLPSIMPWAIVALVLVLISLGIRLFWPIPAAEKLPRCDPSAKAQTACVRTNPVPAPAGSPTH